MFQTFILEMQYEQYQTAASQVYCYSDREKLVGQQLRILINQLHLMSIQVGHGKSKGNHILQLIHLPLYRISCLVLQLLYGGFGVNIDSIILEPDSRFSRHSY
jgi:hypothetical protein